MASFRTGFKIFGEFSLKQGLGRIRSFSEDRKPGQWLPEDQWAVRQPGSTCPDPCEKPKKPAKPSKSWLSICRDPPKELECDVRHSNCPAPEKYDAPWYSIENFIPKKKHEKPPALDSCREELKRRDMYGESEEVCENITEKCFPENIKPEPSECCMPKREPCPAPVVTLTCPLPKELDISLWCERPCTDTSRIPTPCQSDRLPYDEFRPQKCWKPPPFSLPSRYDSSSFLSARCRDTIPYSEFKNVELPKPLYTRYKSVELTDKSTMFCMTEVKCAEDDLKDLAITPLSPNTYKPASLPCVPQETVKKEECPEKPVVEAASCKPIRIKKAPKYKFKPKPTKLVERTTKLSLYGRNVKPCDLTSREENDESDCTPLKEDESERPKVITGTLTDEPLTYEREPPMQTCPPRWMYSICKPGSKKTPLLPSPNENPEEPDCSSETDGLNFYDGKDENIIPKPAPDPCLAQAPKTEPSPPETEAPEPIQQEPEPCIEIKERFVLMPQEYNIKFRGCIDEPEPVDDPESSTFEKFIEVKTKATQKCSKSYPPMKENILYDLQRLCPNPPLDPSKLNTPCRKPPKPDCPQPPLFYRRICTLSPATQGKLNSFQLCKIQQRTECGDSSGKCKARSTIPKPRPCPDPPKKAECAQMALPCCQRSKVPPDCEVKRPMPLCKKKLPPKPAFSECSKDPPPCPRMVECDCWEKKPGGK